MDFQLWVTSDIALHFGKEGVKVGFSFAFAGRTAAHSSPSTTPRYGNLSVDSTKKAGESLGRTILT
jgi:hypothetical protein